MEKEVSIKGTGLRQIKENQIVPLPPLKVLVLPRLRKMGIREP